MREGSADLLAKMILYIVDPWGWERGSSLPRRESGQQGVLSVAERRVIPLQLLLPSGILAISRAPFLLLTAL